MGYRNPSLLVKMATALDHMSGGRMTLGIGAGWFEREHRAFGFPFLPVGERLDRLEEAAAICRGLLDGETVTYPGRWYSAEGAVNDPPPLQARMPLLIGGSGERRTLPIVARYADEWSGDGGDPETFARKSRILEEHCRAIGRDPRTIRRTAGQLPPLIRASRDEAVRALATIYVAQGAAPGPAERAAAASPFAGTVENVVANLRAFRDVGLEEVHFDWAAPFDRWTLDALAGPVRDRLAAG